ncbi:MAG: orotidine 5'-phosphate decarboxylase [Thaumarchaeota archaeon]|nr:orotidine 5'-phosphate decarboxylase [Nitrososphaerota archaeon]
MKFGERLKDSSKRHGSKIILALDITGPQSSRAERAEALLVELGDSLAGVKVNFQLLLPQGLQGLARVAEICSEKALPLIADIKLNDIESTNLETVELLFGSGFDAVIANPFAGHNEGLSKVIARARALGKGVILLVYMSHAGAEEGYALKVGEEPMYLRFARKVREWGADGAIVSAKSLEIIKDVRRTIDPWQLILSPGIGFQGGEADKAIRAGTDLAIVGRSIIDAKSPRAMLREFNQSISDS